MLGFDARQFLYVDRRLGLLARLGAGDIRATVFVVIGNAVVGGFQLLAFVLVASFQFVLFQFFVAHVLPHDLRKAG
ncbi:hypothetical protein D3C78_1527140 [compost metagenome]